MKFKPILIDPDLTDIIDPFINNTISDFKLLEGHIKSNNYEQIRRVCHRILGTAVSYGFVEMDTIVREIQTAATKEDSKELNDSFKIFESHIIFIKEQFQYQG